MSATATSSANILSFVGGVAVAGIASGDISYTWNHIHNTVEAYEVNDGATASSITAANVTISASDASTIDSTAIGLAASIYASAGAAIADNSIGNTVEAAIIDSTVAATPAVNVEATSSGDHSQHRGRHRRRRRRSSAGVGHGQRAEQHDRGVHPASTVSAGGAVLVEAEDTPPARIPSYLSSMSLSTDIVND